MLFKENKKPILVWTYHRVLPDKGNTAVSEQIFREQIEYLLKKNYTFITTEELKDWFENKIDNSRKYTVLTFDDGWADNYFFVQPILKEYNIKAVLALNTGLIDTKSDLIREKDQYPVIDSKVSLYNSAYGINKDSFLTKNELIKMHYSNFWDIQAHGNSHFGTFHSLKKIRGFYPYKEHWTMRFALGEEIFEGAPRAEFRSILAEPLTELKKELIDKLKVAENDSQRIKICNDFRNPISEKEENKDFLERIATDMSVCKNWLKSTLDKDCKSMFWPWGHYSDDCVKAAETLGFEMLFTMNKAALDSNSSSYEIPRIAAPDTLKRFIHQEKIFTSQFKTMVRNFFAGQKN